MVVADTGDSELNEGVDMLADHDRNFFDGKLYLVAVKCDTEEIRGTKIEKNIQDNQRFNSFEVKEEEEGVDVSFSYR